MLVMGDNDLAADRGQVRTILEKISPFPPTKKKRKNFVITIPATFSNINQHLTFLGWEKGYFSKFRPGVRSFVGWFVHFLNNA